MAQLSKSDFMPVRRKSPYAKHKLDTWLRDINDLMQQVREWASEQKEWDTLIEQGQEIPEAGLGTYFAPKLTIHMGGRTALMLEPKARNVLGSDGRIDLYAYPTLHRVQLLRNEAEGIWIVHTDSGIDWPNSWNRDTFFDLARRLTATA